MTRLLSLPLLLLTLVTIPASGQAFSWFSTTMAMSGTEDGAAAVTVLPVGAWEGVDSASVLGPIALGMIERARAADRRVVARVSANLAQAAAAQVEGGLLDGLIIDGTGPIQPVQVPDGGLLLMGTSSPTANSGYLSRYSAGSPLWTWRDSPAAVLDSIYDHRAATADRPTPHRGVTVVGDTESVGDAAVPLILMPGSILLEANLDEGSLGQAVLAFRLDHASVASGIHRKLQDAPYAIYRGIRLSRDETDEVIVVMGVEGKTRVNVSAVFDDDVILRDRLTGAIALVSFGQAAFTPHESGFLLLEVLD